MDSLDIVNRILRSDLYTRTGKIDQIVGLTVETTGPICNIGDVCTISSETSDKVMSSEVVGFRGNKVLLMPYGDMSGMGYGSTVRNTGRQLEIGVGPDLIGRTVDALGHPIDDGPPIEPETYYPINGKPSNPLMRPSITDIMQLGVKAIDGLITIGKGQRIGIFAGSGVGKSTLMGKIARHVKADVNVIALVGERGREVVDFISNSLGPEGLARSVLVVATSDTPAMMRSKCALTATCIAEYFRDQGLDVLLMMDSLTRYSMAQREIGLSIGEPPVARGYTPSIYSDLPKLLERSGNFEKGSITGIYTVLVEGDDANEPISDTVRSIIDGHIMLSRKLATKNHYPAIDVLSSISRLMSEIADRKQIDLAGRMRSLMALYNSNEDLISIGAYKSGTNSELDHAIACKERIDSFLKQRNDETHDIDETVRMMQEAIT